MDEDNTGAVTEKDDAVATPEAGDEDDDGESLVKGAQADWSKAGLLPPVAQL